MAAETQQQLVQDGQEVSQYDFNNVATEAAHAEDYVFAEMLRLAPYNGSASAKAIIPFGPSWGGALANNGICQGTSNGKVNIFPFRAIVGSRTAIAAYTPPAGAPALATNQNNPNVVSNQRGIRSALYMPTDDNVNLGHQVGISNNLSGNPRIDLIYATMTVDAPGASITRMVRPPVANVAPAVDTLALHLIQPIAITVLPGTPSGSPTPPSLPADNAGAGTYNFPLCYVMVPNGFTAGSSTTIGQIQIVAPCVPFDGKSTGAFRARPSTSISSDTSQLPLAGWAGGTRPPHVLPTSMVGGECLLIATSLTSSTNTPADASVVDSSIDWRGRAFLWFAQVGNGQANMAYTPGYLSTSAPNGNIGNIYVPANYEGAALSAGLVNGSGSMGFGQSFGVDDTNAVKGLGLGSTRTGATVLSLSNGNTGDIVSPQIFGLYVDMTTGHLKAYNGLTFGTQGAKGIFIWLFASAQIDNDLF